METGRERGDREGAWRTGQGVRRIPLGSSVPPRSLNLTILFSWNQSTVSSRSDAEGKVVQSVKPELRVSSQATLPAEKKRND